MHWTGHRQTPAHAGTREGLDNIDNTMDSENTITIHNLALKYLNTNVQLQTVIGVSLWLDTLDSPILLQLYCGRQSLEVRRRLQSVSGDNRDL